MRRPDGPRYTRRPKPKAKEGEQPLSGKPNTLKVIPLGGNEETGSRNCYVIQYNQEILIVDMGLQWPEEDMPGVDYIIPDTNYLRGKEKMIRGVIITHGHMDHIGAAAHLIPGLGNPPVYASDLTCALVQQRMDELAPNKKLRLNRVKTRDRIKLGNFRLQFFGLSHNIPASLGVVIETPAGVIVHTGDFKLDAHAHINNRTDIDFIRTLGRRNITALLCDSTNAPAQGHQLSEEEVEKNIQTMFTQSHGRIIIATFPRTLSRVQQVITAAEKYNRKVLLEGYSMKTIFEIGRQLGYIRVKPNTITSWDVAQKLPANRYLILCTGAQGEDNAVLMRIANREHKYLRVEKGDLIVFSSSVIPGNERSVSRLKDGLLREGAEIIDSKVLDIHAGGHAKADDIIDLIHMIRPKYFMPIEGSFSFLLENKKNAIKAGIPADRILIADNGQEVEFHQGHGYVTNQRHPINYVFVDGLGIGDVNHIVLRDRKQLAGDGMVIVVAQISRNGKIGKVDIVSRGFTFIQEQGKLLHDLAAETKKALQAHDRHQNVNESHLRDNLRKHLEKFLFDRTHRQPMILPVIMEV